jgi:hypothetical protein
VNLQALTEALETFGDFTPARRAEKEQFRLLVAAARAYANLFTPDGNLNPSALEAAAKAFYDLDDSEVLQWESQDERNGVSDWYRKMAAAAVRAFLDHEETT